MAQFTTAVMPNQIVSPNRLSWLLAAGQEFGEHARLPVVFDPMKDEESCRAGRTTHNPHLASDARTHIFTRSLYSGAQPIRKPRM